MAEYYNDEISVDQSNQLHNSTSEYMYEKLKTEGHDYRLLRFRPSTTDKTIPGGHIPIQNEEHWIVGCLGITPKCNQVEFDPEVLLAFRPATINTYSGCHLENLHLKRF